MDTRIQKYSNSTVVAESDPEARYETSLAEFPIFFLSKRPPVGMDNIVYSDTIKGKDGPVERTWKVTWSRRYGPGVQCTAETFFALFQIWSESNFSTPFIHFGSINTILRRRGMSDGQVNFQRVLHDLHCLCNIYIEAKNAFWDSTKDRYIDASFHLFESLWLEKESEGNPDPTTKGIIESNKILFSAVQKNVFLLGLNEEEFFKLPGLQQRLFLYLRKMLIYQKFHIRNIHDLARQIPLFASAKFKLKQELKEATEGLMASNLLPQLGGFKFVPAESTSGVELIRFERADARQLEIFNTEKDGASKEDVTEYNFTLITDLLQDKHSYPFYHKVASLFDTNTICRALSEVKDFDREVRQKGGNCNAGKIFTSRIKSLAAQKRIEV